LSSTCTALLTGFGHHHQSENCQPGSNRRRSLRHVRHMHARPVCRSPCLSTNHGLPSMANTSRSPAFGRGAASANTCRNATDGLNSAGWRRVDALGVDKTLHALDQDGLADRGVHAVEHAGICASVARDRDARDRADPLQAALGERLAYLLDERTAITRLAADQEEPKAIAARVHLPDERSERRADSRVVRGRRQGAACRGPGSACRWGPACRSRCRRGAGCVLPSRPRRSPSRPVARRS